MSREGAECTCGQYEVMHAAAVVDLRCPVHGLCVYAVCTTCGQQIIPEDRCICPRVIYHPPR